MKVTQTETYVFTNEAEVNVGCPSDLEPQKKQGLVDSIRQFGVGVLMCLPGGDYTVLRTPNAVMLNKIKAATYNHRCPCCGKTDGFVQARYRVDLMREVTDVSAEGTRGTCVESRVKSGTVFTALVCNHCNAMITPTLNDDGTLSPGQTEADLLAPPSNRGYAIQVNVEGAMVEGGDTCMSVLGFVRTDGSVVSEDEPDYDDEDCDEENEEEENREEVEREERWQ